MALRVDHVELRESRTKEEIEKKARKQIHGFSSVNKKIKGKD